VVNTSDLDLSTGWGVHVLRDRVERAAADACNELDNQWTVGLYPLPDENTTDCIRNAADRAMYQAGVY
jgi:UrcA family protein